MIQPSRDSLRAKAASMRKNPTPSEAKLWSRLRRKNLAGRKFRRQHVLTPFIVDFYCPAVKLVIELDGPIHGREGECRDTSRTIYLQENFKVKVIRFANEEVRQDIESVLRRIERHL